MPKEDGEDRPAGSATNATSGGGSGKLEDYRLMGKLGEGTFSEVLKVKQKKSGRISAMKRFRKHFKSFEEIETLREIQALRRLNPHQHIVDLEDVIFDPKHGILSLNFELMECNLYELISQRKTSALLTESKARLFMYQICKALEYIHGKGIFHRDIKPENILVKDNNIKIADFGSCRGIHSKQPYTEYIATRWYRPPECLLTAGFYSYKMDIWGAGCVLFEIVSRVPLFPGSNELDQLHRIHAVMGTPKKELLRYMAGSKAASVKYNFPPKEGTGIRALIPHVQTECVDLINALLAYNPDERISSRDALRYAYFKDMPASELERSVSTRSAAASGGPFKSKSARRKGSLHAVSLSIPQLPAPVVVATGGKGAGGNKVEIDTEHDSRPAPAANSYLKANKSNVTISNTHGTVTTVTTTITNKTDAPKAHGAAHPAAVVPTLASIAAAPANKQYADPHHGPPQQQPQLQDSKAVKIHHTAAGVATGAQSRSHPQPAAPAEAAPSGTLQAIPQHVRSGPFITSTNQQLQHPQQQHSQLLLYPTNVNGAANTASTSSSSSTGLFPPIAAGAGGQASLTTGNSQPSNSTFYAKFKQDDKRAAAAVAAAVLEQGGMPRLHGRLRAQAAQSGDHKPQAQWGNTVVGKNVSSPQKLPTIIKHSQHQNSAVSSNPTNLPHLPAHLTKHESSGEMKGRPKELLVLPSLGPEKTNIGMKVPSSNSAVSPSPTMFPAIKNLGGSKPGNNK
ncbi:hypothetical protein HDU86_003061 [Geranomyces michiganensis]|nr:hypothetical protein HDU86_003061 [Geranomyces michiganensis]